MIIISRFYIKCSYASESSENNCLVAKLLGGKSPSFWPREKAPKVKRINCTSNFTIHFYYSVEELCVVHEVYTLFASTILSL